LRSGAWCDHAITTSDLAHTVDGAAPQTGGSPAIKGCSSVEVHEVTARVLRRYWAVLLGALLVPTVAVGLVVGRAAPTYTAHARILAAAAVPRAQAEAAAVVSQVQALATSRDVVASALDDARLPRGTDRVVEAVTVTGFGTSAVVDLAYTDRDPEMARAVTAVLAKAVVKQLDAVRIGGLPDVLKDVDNQLTELAAKRATIAAEAQANPKDPVAQNRLAGIDRLISDLSGDRNRLAEDAAAAGHSSIVASPVKPRTADSRGLPAKLAVAAILGLSLGLVIAGINETLRPAVSGASRVSRLLDVPLLGAINPDPAVLADVGRRIRLAARKAGVSTVVLVRATREHLAPELIDRVEAATLRPTPVAGRLAIPIDTRETGLTNLPIAGAPPRVSKHSNDNHASVAMLAMTEQTSRVVPLYRVCALSELDPSSEADRIAVVVLAGGSTRLTALDSVRDLLAASDWPLLGVLADGRIGRGGRS
jgi:capsular polysaccharide biosynthesis protein